MKASFLNAELMRLHNLIRKKSTGTPAELARKLRCSERSVYHKIERLKAHNLPVIYDNLRQSYCYTREVSIVFNILVDGEAMNQVRGGFSLFRTGYGSLFQGYALAASYS